MTGDSTSLFARTELEAAFLAASPNAAKAALSSAELDFIRQAYDDARADELPGLSVADFGRFLADAWMSAETLVDGPHIHLAPLRGADSEARGLDLLVVTQPDAPFLVDSVMGELTEQGFDVRAMFHPVVAVARDKDGQRQGASGLVGIRRESMIVVVLSDVGEDRRAKLIEGVSATLADALVAVADFEPMRALLHATIHELENALHATNSPALARWVKARKGLSGSPREMADEYLNFLRWLGAEHFVFLGARIYEYPRLANGDYAPEEPGNAPGGSLGVLRDDTLAVLRRASEPAVLTSELKGYLETSPPVTVAKSNLRSRVHRRAYMDYIGVKRYAPDGAAIGEVRFVGLFTAEAYDEAARDIPLIRRKIAHILARAAENPSAHNEKRLRNIIEGYPRDELFQAEDDDLTRIAMGILHLYDRPRIKLFVRRDPFDRFISILFFTPRDRYNSETRELVGRMLAKAWGGRVSAYYPTFGAEPLARVHFVLGVTPKQHLEPNLAQLEAAIDDATRTWAERFAQALRLRPFVGASIGETLVRYIGAFPPGYQDHYAPEEALVDLSEIETLDHTGAALRVRAYRRADDTPTHFRAKLYRRGEAAPLADVLPVFENMGLKALIEDGFPVRRLDEGEAVWVHDFLLHDPRGADLVFSDIKDPFETTFVAVWTGLAENDGFNRLVIELGMSWREAALVRALARYRQQTGLDPSERVQQEALRENPGIARLIVDLFRIKFHPGLKVSLKDRKAQAQAVFAEIETVLQSVDSLDHDRALRRIAALVYSLTRTNFYQTDAQGASRPAISFKIASQALEDLPRPKPYREIFVAAPHVEGVHLRFGPVARGGLRWSDRRDDFRTEVLGLVKAQQVKNAVIVPVGSKGGFYPKQLPKQAAGSEAWRAEGVRAYRTFLQGLLDITDNLDASGAVSHPSGVVALDGDDPYLVVAADKGTATFSDIANAVAQSYDFWLGDAFASGGSAGYDHKAMAITARGAWEAVKRHFRELGKDILSEPFTCVGVGDMSGDVFGNGMLLSRATRLLAAFDHRHIFIDPNPDPETSWAERKRLFDLPRSSWADYATGRLSQGGAIYPRNAKSLTVTPEIQALFKLESDEIAPVDLIRAILCAEVELLYLGGIGTYVKSPFESHAAAGDKANDAIRVDAVDLRCKVVGEGANLGFTQAGRIAYARSGGRINTDAIDNSAGVDTSDHEVNIKILTGQLERAGKLDRAARDALLVGMTEDVADHVLKHNYSQTLCLTLEETEAAADLAAHSKFIADLEAEGRLDRTVEGLPTAQEIAKLRMDGQGLTRPELAVLIAYGKLELDAALVASSAPDDPWFERVLLGYFPKDLAPFADEMARHRLRREIIATRLSNHIVDRLGPTFAKRVLEASKADPAIVARAFAAVTEIFLLDETWTAVDWLDLKCPSETQLALYRQIAQFLRGQIFALVVHEQQSGAERDVGALVDTYRTTAEALREGGSELLSRFERDAAANSAKALIAQGAPSDLARKVAGLSALAATFDIAKLAKDIGWEAPEASRLYHATGAAFGFNRLRAAAQALRPTDAFDRAAVRALVQDLTVEQVRRAAAIAAMATGPDTVASVTAAQALIEKWKTPRRDAIQRGQKIIADIESAGDGWSFAKLTLAFAGVRAGS